MIKPGDRERILTQTRNLKMARSAHAYARGSTVSFYQWLESSRRVKLPEGPPVWICGDCHVGNLGALADTKGHVLVQIRDLDQTVIGNPAHDLVRLGLSLASAARGSDLPGVTTAKILEQVIAGYQAALSGNFKDADKSYRPKTIKKLLAGSTRRRWRHLAEERLDTVKPTIPLGKRFWALIPEERKALSQMFASDAVRPTLTSLRSRTKDDPIELLDAAYWMKGCSSLGRLRYAALLRIGKAKDSSLCLVDVKEGVKAAAPTASKVEMPRDNAIPVVTGAKALSPNLGERMIAARLLGKAVVVRELMPQDLKIEINRLSREEAMGVARYLGGVVGRAHGRQMESGQRRAWRADLANNHKASLEAPSWLWAGVVELIALHEAAYLDHCRRFALSEAA